MEYYKIDENNIAVEGLFNLGEGDTVPEGYIAIPTGDTSYPIGSVWDGTSWSAPALTLEELKRKRGDLLAQSDWTQSTDSPLADSDKQDWATYRQALRELPSSFVSGQTTTFPTPPTTGS